MLSRCWCISRTSAWGRSINSLTNIHSRNHHAIGNALYRVNRTDQKECRISKKTSPLNRIVLSQISAPGFVSARNLSFIPSLLASSKEGAASPEIVDSSQIPDVLAVPINETIQQLAANGEPTFSSLGLGGYSPFAAIALSTVVIRILLTPLVVISQRNAAIMQNAMPEMQDVRNRITEARQTGNLVELEEAKQDEIQLMITRGFDPTKNSLVALVQAPIFISYFIGIREMVDKSVESMQTGGLWWFTDLTLADPYYLLPLLTSSILALNIHLGTDAAPGQESPITLLILKCAPIVMFPFIMNFSAAMVVYWASNNFCSLVQGSLFRMPKVRTFFEIPQIIGQPVLATQDKKKQSFIQRIKESSSNMMILPSSTQEDLRRKDRIKFSRAGTGPPIRTYKFDPTKVKKSKI